MSQFQAQIGSQGLQRRITTSGVQALGNSPGHYSLAASARGTGGFASHRPGAAHVDTPMTASAIRYGSGPRTIRSSERSDSRGRERSISRESRTSSRSASVPGITEIPPDVGTTDAIVRMMPAGPEEARDWAEALDRVANSMGTHENHQRSMAQAMAEQAERVAVLERKLEEVTAYGELTRAYLSEACGNMFTKFVKIEDMAQRDEKSREDLSALQVGIHHNLECHSVVAARLEAVEVQLQNMLNGSQPPPGLD